MSKRNSKRKLNRIESLESRVLLAGDTISAWHNDALPADINGDLRVTPLDVLGIMRILNTDGSHKLPARAAGEPDSSSNQLMVDVNNDGHISPIDALGAIRAQGEGEEFQVRLEITRPEDGQVIQNVNSGDTFRLNVYVQDLRGVDAVGVFSAYPDVTYDSSLVSVAQGASVVHADPFDDGTFSDISVPGLLDEPGGFNRGATGDGSEELLWQLDMVADAPGVVTFQTDHADELPARHFLGNDDITPIDPTNILYGNVELTINEVRDDFADFAKALSAAGVEFWSTRQFNTDAVAQRALFQDAGVYLPFTESLDSAGELTAAATAAGVTAVNTWIFPDQSQATGVLSLDELATRSGIAIPESTGPTLKPVVANNEVSLEFGSPLQLPLDTYSADNGPITYTITVDDPNLVESTMITGNRSWALDISGYGAMLFEFFEGRAPRATAQFIELTEDDFYDGLTFHRVIDDFVIQGGDPNGDGTGGSNLPDFLDQFHVDLQHNQVGVLSMAKSADDTNNSQFFVTDDTTRHLDFNHTIFGQLIEGYDVLEAISAVPVTNPGIQDRPVTPVVINSANVINDRENGIVMLRALAESGTTNVTITATDSSGRTDTQTFAVNLSEDDDSNNGQPFLGDIPDFTAQPDTTFTFQLDGIDVEGDQILYDVISPSPNGVTASVSDEGLVTVNIPDTVDFGDEVRLTVRAYETFPTSSRSPRDEQRVSLRIVEELVAVDDAERIDEDSGVHTFDVLANDQGDNPTIISVSTPADGALVEITSDNKINYTPAPNFPIESTVAQDSVFTYTIMSGDETSVGTVTVTVDPVNDPPTANDDAFPADFNSNDAAQVVQLREDAGVDTLLRLILNDQVTPDEELVSIDSVSSQTGATLQITNINTAVNYRAAANRFGTDTFEYVLEDSGGLTDTATVTVEIAQVNDQPEPAADTIDVTSGIGQTIAADTFLGNDSAGPFEDASQTLTITNVSQPQNGSVTLNSDGTVTYTANPSFSGTDSFTYTVTDDGITENFDESSSQFIAAADPLSAVATVTVNVAENEFAEDDTFDVDGRRDTVSLDVLNNDDLSLSPTITSVTDATNGTVAIINNGLDISYSRNAGFTGADSFTYTLTDSQGSMATATVTLNVLANNTPPTALDDIFTVQNDGTQKTLDVLANDEVEASETATIIGFIDIADNGNVGITADGLSVVYLPNAGFSGTDSFIYQMSDGNGGLDTAMVTITVEQSNANANPVAVDDAFTISGGAERPLDVLVNDTTEAGETLTIESIVTPPTNGVARISQDGSQIFYERIDDDVTSDSFVYRIGDGNGGFDTGTVDITVLQTNLAPTAVDDSFDVNNTAEQSLDVLANDTTEADETLTIDAITVSPTKGTASISSDGKMILYTANSAATGTDTLTYQVNDGNGGVDSAVVTLNLDVVNQDPVAIDDSTVLQTTGEQVINVLANDQTQAGRNTHHYRHRWSTSRHGRH